MPLTLHVAPFAHGLSSEQGRPTLTWYVVGQPQLHSQARCSCPSKLPASSPRGVFFISTEVCLLFLTCGSLSCTLGKQKGSVTPPYVLSPGQAKAQDCKNGLGPRPALLEPGHKFPALTSALCYVSGKPQPRAQCVLALSSSCPTAKLKKRVPFCPFVSMFLNPGSQVPE